MATTVIKSRLPSWFDSNFFMKYIESFILLLDEIGIDPINVLDALIKPNSCETISEQLILLLFTRCTRFEFSYVYKVVEFIVKVQWIT